MKPTKTEIRRELDEGAALVIQSAATRLVDAIAEAERRGLDVYFHFIDYNSNYKNHQ